MITVQLPHDTVMIEEFCRESPWGTITVMKSEVEQWLESHGWWDYDITDVADYHVVFFFKDPATALLFKLTWG
jgi:hypothetical protein